MGTLLLWILNMLQDSSMSHAQVLEPSYRVVHLCLRQEGRWGVDAGLPIVSPHRPPSLPLTQLCKYSPAPHRIGLFCAALGAQYADVTAMPIRPWQDQWHC